MSTVTPTTKQALRSMLAKGRVKATQSSSSPVPRNNKGITDPTRSQSETEEGYLNLAVNESGSYLVPQPIKNKFPLGQSDPLSVNISNNDLPSSKSPHPLQPSLSREEKLFQTNAGREEDTLTLVYVQNESEPETSLLDIVELIPPPTEKRGPPPVRNKNTKEEERQVFLAHPPKPQLDTNEEDFIPGRILASYTLSHPPTPNPVSPDSNSLPPKTPKIDPLTGWRHFCPICQKSFRTPFHLRRHIVVHTRETPFPCPGCGRRFADKSNLVKHARLHDPDPDKRLPFSCVTCGKSFSRRDNLTTHVNMVHLRLEFNCPLCQLGFASKFNLRAHLDASHLGIRFPCPRDGCGKLFKSRQKLGRHLKKDHKSEEEDMED